MRCAVVFVGLVVSVALAACGGAGSNASDAAPSDVAISDVAISDASTAAYVQQAYAKASNTESADFFGGAAALSVDGNTLAVGAFNESSAATGIGGNQADNTAQGYGAVYVFTRAGANWTQQAYIKASNSDANDYFGTSVTLSADGSTLAVGAGNESSAATGIEGNQVDNSASQSGAVYVLTRAGTTWTQQAYIKASNPDANDHFGEKSVALSSDGNTLAVGAYGESSAATGIGGNQADNTAVSAGAVYVFTRTGTTWTQQAYVKASNSEAIDHFGESIALSSDGNTLAAGAPEEQSAATGVGGNQADNTAGNSGAVYVFTRAGTAWTQQAYIKASNTGPNDFFGQDVALSSDGNTLAVGAINESSAATGIGGNQSDNSASNSGAVYLFTRPVSTWIQQAYVKASNTGTDDNFGVEVALSVDGSKLMVGAFAESSGATGIGGNEVDDSTMNSGATYAFTRANTTWSQEANIKASNTGPNDRFGKSVALSADGGTVVVGAFAESSSATGIGGNQADNSAAASGAVYIFAVL